MIRTEAKLLKKLLFVCLMVGLPVAASGQGKTKKPAAKKPAKVVKKTSPPAVESDTITAPKANERPAETVPDTSVKVNKRGEGVKAQDAVKAVSNATHFYYFAQPEFEIDSISIEHDDTGKGQISFSKKGWDEPASDPIQVSPAALGRIENALRALDFVNSNENYQYEKDYSHLGNVKIHIKKDGRERTAAFNWTLNKDAKALADEYRKIANQAIWMFDITVSRQNQPLNSPKLMDLLDSYMRRDEISDMAQILPFLQGISNDERLPLIARNHAAKLAKDIEKQVAKKGKG
jgi:hypothetical protein